MLLVVQATQVFAFEKTPVFEEAFALPPVSSSLSNLRQDDIFQTFAPIILWHPTEPHQLYATLAPHEITRIDLSDCNIC